MNLTIPSALPANERESLEEGSTSIGPTLLLKCEGLDAAQLATDDQPKEVRPTSLRWAYQHMIEEDARHNGHADLLRERIDGTVGD